MFSTLGVILTVVSVLLCSLGILLLLILRHAGRVLRSSAQVSPATSPERAPERWESRLAELEADVVSLSSSFEKTARAVTRQNARDVMRERRSRTSESAEGAAPPKGASKAELYRHYGLAGKTSVEIARKAQELTNTENERQH